MIANLETEMINELAYKYQSLFSRHPNINVIKEKIKIIIQVLRSGSSWISLSFYESIKFSESTIRKFFYTLCDKGIISNEVKKLRTQNTPIIFIDSTTICNKIGSKDTIGFCPQNKKHKGNKVSVAVNEKGKPIGYSIGKASTHDITLLEETVSNIPTKIIVGDKAYISKALEKKFKNKEIKLVTPIKKNQKKKLTTYEKKLLKERFVVERTFGNLKKFRRINNRYEYKLKYFIGFIELSLLLMS